jgi:putative peptide zinc metalloprotease protein
MSALFNSSVWYRVAALRPALRSHVGIQRHVYRDELWYVINDPASGRQHRFPIAAQTIISLMDGTRTVQEIWDTVDSNDAAHDISQDEILQLLAQLHAADLLSVPIVPDTAELLRRAQTRQRNRLRGRFMNPMALRFPLFDPDRLLARLLPAVRRVFGPGGLMIWLACIGAAALLAGMHWPELTENLSDRILTPGNLALLWVTYPVIKGLHEMGHGLAAKRWGGEVHEMGIMMLVFAPVPYVDASCSSAFPDKHQRMVVGAAGIFVELLIAALAMFVWVAVEPGLVRAIAFNVMLIGAISTVLMNGNPLLRFDGYYVLADALEIPNLGNRSNRYIGYLVRRYLFGFTTAKSPTNTTDEACWLGAYAVTSFAYRMFIMFVIILMVADRFFILGTLLACWGITMQLIMPAIKNLRALTGSAEFRLHRRDNMARGGAIVAAVGFVLVVVPLPLTTHVEGVVWLPPDSEIRAGADAIITRVVATPNSMVRPDDVLLEMDDPELIINARILEAKLAEANARYNALRATDPARAEMLQQEIDRIEADLAVAREHVEALMVRSKRSGHFIIARPQDLQGRFVRNGELLGFVADPTAGTVVVAVSQDDIGLIRARTKHVTFRLAEQLDEVITASISRATPAASNKLPSAALGSNGGGRFATNPADDEGLATLERVFQLELTSATPLQRFGERTYVRFDHGYQPLAMQWYRQLRQVFLSQLDV